MLICSMNDERTQTVLVSTVRDVYLERTTASAAFVFQADGKIAIFVDFLEAVKHLPECKVLINNSKHTNVAKCVLDGKFTNIIILQNGNEQDGIEFKCPQHLWEQMLRENTRVDETWLDEKIAPIALWVQCGDRREELHVLLDEYSEGDLRKKVHEHPFFAGKGKKLGRVEVYLTDGKEALLLDDKLTVDKVRQITAVVAQYDEESATKIEAPFAPFTKLQITDASVASANVLGPQDPIFDGQKQIASRLFEAVENSLTRPLTEYKKLKYIILSINTLSLQQQTLDALDKVRDFYGLHKMTEWPPVVKANLNEMKVEKSSKWADFLASAKQNEDTLHVLLVDECHYGIVKGGCADAFINAPDVKACPNIVHVLISATPFAVLTADSQIAEVYKATRDLKGRIADKETTILNGEYFQVVSRGARLPPQVMLCKKDGTWVCPTDGVITLDSDVPTDENWKEERVVRWFPPKVESKADTKPLLATFQDIEPKSGFEGTPVIIDLVLEAEGDVSVTNVQFGNAVIPSSSFTYKPVRYEVSKDRRLHVSFNAPASISEHQVVDAIITLKHGEHEQRIQVFKLFKYGEAPYWSLEFFRRTIAVRDGLNDARIRTDASLNDFIRKDKASSSPKVSGTPQAPYLLADYVASVIYYGCCHNDTTLKLAKEEPFKLPTNAVRLFADTIRNFSSKVVLLIDRVKDIFKISEGLTGDDVLKHLETSEFAEKIRDKASRESHGDVGDLTETDKIIRHMLLRTHKDRGPLRVNGSVTVVRILDKATAAAFIETVDAVMSVFGMQKRFGMVGDFGDCEFADVDVAHFFDTVFKERSCEGRPAACYNNETCSKFSKCQCVCRCTKFEAKEEASTIRARILKRLQEKKKQSQTAGKSDEKSDERILKSVALSCKTCSHPHKRMDIYKEMSVPCILVIVDKGRLGDTFPAHFDHLDLRVCHTSKSVSTLASVIQELGRVCGRRANVKDLTDLPTILVSSFVADKTGFFDKLEKTSTVENLVCPLDASVIRKKDESNIATRIGYSAKAKKSYDENRANDFKKMGSPSHNHWHQRRILLDALPQIGKTGAFLYLLVLLQQAIDKTGSKPVIVVPAPRFAADWRWDAPYWADVKRRLKGWKDKLNPSKYRYQQVQVRLQAFFKALCEPGSATDKKAVFVKELSRFEGMVSQQAGDYIDSSWDQLGEIDSFKAVTDSRTIEVPQDAIIKLLSMLDMDNRINLGAVIAATREAATPDAKAALIAHELRKCLEDVRVGKPGMFLVTFVEQVVFTQTTYTRAVRETDLIALGSGANATEPLPARELVDITFEGKPFSVGVYIRIADSELWRCTTSGGNTFKDQVWVFTPTTRPERALLDWSRVDHCVKRQSDTAATACDDPMDVTDAPSKATDAATGPDNCFAELATFVEEDDSSRLIRFAVIRESDVEKFEGWFGTVSFLVLPDELVLPDKTVTVEEGGIGVFV
eukprot:TRINITY_DN1229_c0_g1_i12.p1 TRINITY_DN1229_c0_g1~~TRINITY_DN1229_c0_g1_i12.p1  ORF type:complete len:1460 (-),score=316.30 TRINITY_DN1229_c0_g1_i12:1974-6353(-)